MLRASFCTALVLVASLASAFSSSFSTPVKANSIIKVSGKDAGVAQPKAVIAAATKVILTNDRHDPVTEVIAKVEPSVVAIRVPNTDMIGSGLVVEVNGEVAYIITNAHVTGGKKVLNVRLADGTDEKGMVIARDTNLDLAIVQISTKVSLTALTLAKGNDLIKGEKVVAIGHPYGYEGTATDGRISALNRVIPMPNEVKMAGLIQHSAPINPGNSGGPLVNINGEVVGVNVALRDGANLIAFAINADTVKSFINQNIAK